MKTALVDRFEYKGRLISVHRDENNDFYFNYKEGKEEITLPFADLESFIKSPFTHTSIDSQPVDLIEKSIKINELLYNYEDLVERMQKYN
jgi:hypothetical protein